MPSVSVCRCLNNAGQGALETYGGVAGAAGFEPANADTKNRCLTTWPRPIKNWADHKGKPLSLQRFTPDSQSSSYAMLIALR